MRPKLTIQDMNELARKRGGRCLSKEYVNNYTKLLWGCAKGHQWENTPAHIKRGQWCPVCAGVIRLTISNMSELARNRGGKCLSTEYVNNKTKLLWECAEGHRWEATPDNVKHGKWCPRCAGAIKLTLQEMQELAAKEGGKCLSQKYMNARTKLLWECAEGHQWKAVPFAIKRGQWCPVCGRKKAADSLRLTIKDMRKVARERGGRCLSKIYTNARTKLLWECAEGHRWKATPSAIVSGRWCHECSIGIGERICRAFFEQLFERKFRKAFPDWLVNQSGKQMELDGYSRELGLAFEHQGKQHYDTSTRYIKTQEVLSKRKRDDLTKRQLCKANGVVLIEVPEIPSMLGIDRVKPFIRKACLEKDVPLPKDFGRKKVILKKAYAPSFLQELQSIAMARGGKCLAQAFLGWRETVEWECSEGHRWKARPDHVRRGHWCAKCAHGRIADAQRLTIEDMQEIARQRGGRCLSKLYINSHTKLVWECVQGHRWKAAPGNVKQGSWCRKCAGLERDTIENMRIIAEERRGRCLSSIYMNARTKLLWECPLGHRWMATPDKIKGGRWCPVCGREKQVDSLRLGIEEMQEIARERGGKCVSKSYNNNRTKLLWECAIRHQWTARPKDVKQGTWCPVCSRLKRKPLNQPIQVADYSLLLVVV